MGNVKNLFDQTRAGQFKDDAKPIKSQDFSAKTKLFVKRPAFYGEVGRRGYIPAVRTVSLNRLNTRHNKAKISDFGQIKIAGRR